METRTRTASPGHREFSVIARESSGSQSLLCPPRHSTLPSPLVPWCPGLLHYKTCREAKEVTVIRGEFVNRTPAGSSWGVCSGEWLLFMANIREGLALGDKGQQGRTCASVGAVRGAPQVTLCSTFQRQVSGSGACRAVAKS